MSTDYGLYCRNCNKRAFYDGTFDTHWDRILEIFRERQNLARVMPLIRELNKIKVFSFEVSVSLDYGNSFPLDIFEFLEAHNGHDIVILDEYGHLRAEDYTIIGDIPMI
jgi:hypothetical protein